MDTLTAEIRAHILKPIEIKVGTDGVSRIEGYAAVWYDPSVPGTEFRLGPNRSERIDRHAFSNALASGNNVYAYYNHSDNFILGDTDSGTLHLDTDNVGLKYSIQYDDNDPDFAKVASKIRKKIAKGSSFKAVLGATISHERGTTIRNITNITHFEEISICNNPCYTASSAVLRSLEDFERTEKLIIRARSL